MVGAFFIIFGPMTTVNSLSGGKTSSYLATHYPADYNVFALVRIEDRSCTPKDSGLVKAVSDKIGMEFIATAESDSTLKAVLDLEQLIGKDIHWVTGMTFEETVKKQGNILPNVMVRFCTHKMKLDPIFNFCYNRFGVVDMRIGFRYDEIERSFRQKTAYKTIVGKLPDGRNKWGEIEWRVCSFPLIEDKVSYPTIISWAENSGIVFPRDSNCVGCFFKPLQQLRKNFEEEPEKMNWFMGMETSTKDGQKKKQWKKEMAYSDIKRIGLQKEFVFGTGAGCSAGFCTD